MQFLLNCLYLNISLLFQCYDRLMVVVVHIFWHYALVCLSVDLSTTFISILFSLIRYFFFIVDEIFFSLSLHWMHSFQYHLSNISLSISIASVYLYRQIMKHTGKSWNGVTTTTIVCTYIAYANIQFRK